MDMMTIMTLVIPGETKIKLYNVLVIAVVFTILVL